MLKDAVPYVKLSKTALSKCLELLYPANKLLVKWSEICFGPRKSREFRKLLFKGHRDGNIMKQMEENVPPHLLTCFRSEREDIISIHVTENKDLDNRTVEYAMLCGFSALARKHARRWFSYNGEGNGVSFDDYLEEAYLCLLDSIYGYTNKDISFSSFLWKALQNRMSYVTNKSNLLCPLTNPDLELLTKYEDTKRKFNDHVTFDQVVEAMGLDDKQYNALTDIMTKVLAESQMGELGFSDDRDYTGYRRGVELEEDQNIIRLTVHEAIERAGLTDFERIVLEASMTLDPSTNEPYYGWQSKVARENINPNTDKPYSRMAVTYALQHAYEKIKAQMVA